MSSLEHLRKRADALQHAALLLQGQYAGFKALLRTRIERLEASGDQDALTRLAGAIERLQENR